VPRMTHPFLSDEWLDAIHALLLAHQEEIPDDADVVLNVEVTETPFGTDRRFHIGARAGDTRFGHDFDPEGDVTMACDYDTATSVFVSGDPSAALSAFVSGKIRIQGDVSKLMSGGVMAALPLATPELAEEVKAITLLPDVDG